MTTYNAIQFSANKIATDLKLFFEIHDHDHLYCTDPDFTKKWGKHIKSLVAERLWGYAEAVFDKPLGEEEFVVDGGRFTLSTALTYFGRVCEEVKMYWKDGAWVEDDIEDEEEEDDSEVCVECEKTEWTYNLENGHMKRLLTFHYKGLDTFCPDCLPYGKGDDEESLAGSTDPLPCYDCCEPTEDEDLICIEGRGGVCKDCLRGDRYKDVEYEGKKENEARMECEECEELFPQDDLEQSSARFLCEDCFKEAGCCDNCGEEPSCDETAFTSVDLKRTLCEDCYKLDKEED